MKQSFRFLIFLLISIITISGCSPTPIYSNENFEDSHYWNDQEIVSINVQYPDFKESHYSNLNAVILTKMQKFIRQYEELCDSRKRNCEQDSSCAKLECYIHVTYTLTTEQDQVLVVFSVREFGGGAAEHGYTETIVYNIKTEKHSEIKSNCY